MKNENNWTGTDFSLNISLFEYGFIAREIGSVNGQNKNDIEWEVLYRNHGDNFSTTTTTMQDLNEWVERYGATSFLSFVGMEKSDWLNQSFVYKLSDLLNYWGNLNILGDNPHLITKEQAKQMIQ